MQNATIRCIRRIRCPIDQLVMQPVDTNQVIARIRTEHVAIVSWLFPVNELQRIMHRRYEAEAFHEWVPSTTSSTSQGDAAADAAPAAAATAETETTTSNSQGKQLLGIATVIVGNNIPAHQARWEKWLDPAPHPTLSIRISVVDRVHWQRTQWLAGSICPSICWGKLPAKIFNIPLDGHSKVEIDAAFDAEKQMYHKYEVRIPAHGFSLSLKDSGVSLLDPKTRITEGFLDNESALRQLALSREVNMSGLGNSVYRQTLWSAPSLPNVARVEQVEFGTLFERYLGCVTPAQAEPVAAWLVDEVSETCVYAMEGHVEDENDPNSATTFGERSLVERVQKKAMNRYGDFRDEIRRKTYSDLEGQPSPR